MNRVSSKISSSFEFIFFFDASNKEVVALRDYNPDIIYSEYGGSLILLHS